MSNHEEALVVDVLHALLEHDDYHDMARAAIAAVRKHDEQSALNCGHCTPGDDEIRCACEIGGEE